MNDKNSPSKKTVDDKRRMIEARIEGLKPSSISSSTENVELAVKEALKELRAGIDTVPREN